MALWEDAQRTAAMEVEALQGRVMQLKKELTKEKEQRMRLESKLESYNF